MKRLLLLLLLIIPIVNADIGPKPTADIHLTLQGEEIEGKFYAKMLTCREEDTYHVRDLRPELNISEYDSERDCHWTPTPLAWGGECRNSECSFGYHLPSSFRLAVYLPQTDKVYISKETERNNFNAEFEANLKDKSINESLNHTIEIQETTKFLQSDSADNLRRFIVALFFTLALELLVALVFFTFYRISLKSLILVAIANMITLPIVWFVGPLLGAIGVLLAEVFAFLFEGLFLHLNKRISLKKGILLSLLMNFFSLTIGGGIFFFVSLFIPL